MITSSLMKYSMIAAKRSKTLIAYCIELCLAPWLSNYRAVLFNQWDLWPRGRLFFLWFLNNFSSWWLADYHKCIVKVKNHLSVLYSMLPPFFVVSFFHRWNLSLSDLPATFRNQSRSQRMTSRNLKPSWMGNRVSLYWQELGFRLNREYQITAQKKSASMTGNELM